MIAKRKKMGLRRSQDRDKFYLDGNIAPKLTNYLITHVPRVDKRDHRFVYPATIASIPHGMLGHPHSRVQDAAKKVE